jgi:hypothetical protein
MEQSPTPAGIPLSRLCEISITLHASTRQVLPAAGLPWLLCLRKNCKRLIHFWPFDVWEIPEGKSAVAEVYPALWMRRFDSDGRDGDEHGAYATAAWLQRADRNGSLVGFSPSLNAEEMGIAAIEGWILGVLRVEGIVAVPR